VITLTFIIKRKKLKKLYTQLLKFNLADDIVEVNENQ